MAILPAEMVPGLATQTDTRIVLVVADGLGGLPHPDTGRSELETAATPHLDRLAAQSALGLIDPVAPGIIPGSGPGHLALFGYDPLVHQIGRGALSALGLDFPLRPGDVAVRGNFATVDAQGNLTDRRAGRIPTELNAALCAKLEAIAIPGAQCFVQPEEGYRFLLVVRGPDLSAALSDSDPQVTGQPALPVRPLSEAAARTAEFINAYIARANDLLADERPANAILLRGFAQRPSLPSLTEQYRLRPAAIAVYPMYRGLAQVAGMTVLPTGTDFAAEVETLRTHFAAHDFFFVHFKWTDSAGEDGDFDHKVAMLEVLDQSLPAIIALQPEVLVVTGDHSTPSILSGHSWHPVPLLLHSPWAFPDTTTSFSERTCMQGGLGRFPATQLMPLLLAYARKLIKFGA